MPSIAATMAISGTLRAFASDESSTVARTSAFSCRSLFVIKYCFGAWSPENQIACTSRANLGTQVCELCASQGLHGNTFDGMHRRLSGYIIHVA